MPIAVNCFCGQIYHVREEFAGKPVQCVGCGRIVTVPPASVTPAQASSGPRLSYPEAPPILLALPVEQGRYGVERRHVHREPAPRQNCVA